ncbi:MAG TPA: prepilin-type N-terminal cleavage/methylation domain-containing protein, partial [Alphaproteobacteria bacterium]|nr:prepilin-type N-terminal cleavage/methylation domain-containing protein [Alphaproteobacteria bacterium]
MASYRIAGKDNIMRAKVARSRRGFTLVELAIVLAVSGLLFAGLWRLIANSNQQAQDTHAANGQTQLIQAVTGYLASSEGQTFMATNNATANPYNLPLPTSNNSTADCQAHIAATNKGFCNFLPAGFTNTTPNSYSQTYAIQVMGNGAGANVAPTTYSFMIVTLNGTQIPDSSGGRIASLIGGDGGFLYGTAICTAGIDPSTACGAYGAWSAKITGASPGYNFPAGDAVAGHIASRTYVSPTNSSQLVWLARPLLPGDNAAQPLYNTMQTNMFLGDNAGTGNPNIFYLGKSTTDTHGGEITGTYQNGDLTGVQLT